MSRRTRSLRRPFCVGVLSHQPVPSNDGGIRVGQTASAGGPTADTAPPLQGARRAPSLTPRSTVGPDALAASILAGGGGDELAQSARATTRRSSGPRAWLVAAVLAPCAAAPAHRATVTGVALAPVRPLASQRASSVSGAGLPLRRATPPGPPKTGEPYPLTGLPPYSFQYLSSSHSQHSPWKSSTVGCFLHCFPSFEPPGGPGRPGGIGWSGWWGVSE
jgi:hypothetical protein